MQVPYRCTPRQQCIIVPFCLENEVICMLRVTVHFCTLYRVHLGNSILEEQRCASTVTLFFSLTFLGVTSQINMWLECSERNILMLMERSGVLEHWTQRGYVRHHKEPQSLPPRALNLQHHPLSEPAASPALWTCSIARSLNLQHRPLSEPAASPALWTCSIARSLNLQHRPLSEPAASPALWTCSIARSLNLQHRPLSEPAASPALWTCSIARFLNLQHRPRSEPAASPALWTCSIARSLNLKHRPLSEPAASPALPVQAGLCSGLCARAALYWVISRLPLPLHCRWPQNRGGAHSITAAPTKGNGCLAAPAVLQGYPRAPGAGSISSPFGSRFPSKTDQNPSPSITRLMMNTQARSFLQDDHSFREYPQIFRGLWKGKDSSNKIKTGIMCSPRSGAYHWMKAFKNIQGNISIFLSIILSVRLITIFFLSDPGIEVVVGLHDQSVNRWSN